METKDRGNGVQVIVAPPRLDAVTSPEADKTVQGLVAGGAKRIVFDLTATTYVSSAGLRILLSGLKAMNRAGGQFCLAGVAEPIQEILDTSGFTTLFKIFPTADAAVAG